MLKHTSKPWQAHVMPHRATVYGSDGEVVAEVIEGKGGKARQRANAKLIAVAPDAVDVLEELLFWYSESPYLQDMQGEHRPKAAKIIADAKAVTARLE